MMTNKIAFSEKLPTNDLQKVIEVSARLEINPSWLMAVMYFETAGTLSPAKRNHIGSVGLIQFTRDKAGVEYKTINGKRYFLDSLAKLSFDKQMDVVFEYYKPFRGKIKSFLDCYLVTFFPNALGRSLDYVFETKGLSASLIAKQNPIFDTDQNGRITKGEVLKFWEKHFNKKFPLINQGSEDLERQTSFSIVEMLKYFGFSAVVFFFSWFSLTV